MMQLNLIKPDVPLQPYIKTYWHLKIDEGEANVQTIVPSGLMGLCFYLNQQVEFEGFGKFQTSIGGQRLQSIRAYSQGLEAIGVEFHAYGARMFYQLPVIELFGCMLTPQELNDRGLIELEEQVISAPSLSAGIDSLNRFFIHRLKAWSSIPNSLLRIESSLQLCQASALPATAADLAESACLSPKQYRRLFCEYVGMHPKQYLRLQRLQRTISDLFLNYPSVRDGSSTTGSTLEETAWQHGYYDLPHMDADFQDLLGVSPRELTNRFNPENFSWIDIRETSNNIKYLSTELICYN